MDLSNLDLNGLLGYALTAAGALLATRFPVIGPLLARLLDGLLRPAPAPAPAPPVVPAPGPGPSPVPVPAPAPMPLPLPSPAPQTGRPLIDLGLSFVWALLQRRMRGEALTAEEEQVLEQVRGQLPPGK